MLGNITNNYAPNRFEKVKPSHFKAQNGNLFKYHPLDANNSNEITKASNSIIMDENSLIAGNFKDPFSGENMINEKQEIQKLNGKIQNYTQIKEASQQSDNSAIMYTEEWIIDSSKNRGKSQGPNFCQISGIEGNEEGGGISMEETDKSQITEHFLREENMNLRQEILKLKRALFMSNSNRNSIQKSSAEFIYPVSGSPFQAYDNQVLQQNEYAQNEYEHIDQLCPIMNPPRPYNKLPMKPQLGSSSQASKNDLKLSTDFPLNLIYQTINNENDYGNFQLDLNLVSRSMKAIEPLQSEDTTRNRQQAMQMIDNSIDEFQLRVKAQRNLQIITESLSIQQHQQQFQVDKISSYTVNMDGDSQIMDEENMEQLNSTGELIQVKEGYRDEKEEKNFEDKKRMSSVFEQKRYYEQEIQNLKKDLEMIQQEEEKIRSKIIDDIPFLPINAKFQMFQKEETQQAVERYNNPFSHYQTYQHENAQPIEYSLISESLEKQEMEKQYSIQSQSQNNKNTNTTTTSQRSRHSRFKSSDMIRPQSQINEEQIQNLQSKSTWQPPSFCNTNNNSLSNTMNKEPAYKRRQHSNYISIKNIEIDKDVKFLKSSALKTNPKEAYQSDSQQTYGKQESSNNNIDTELIDKIFEDKLAQLQFKCLDDSSKTDSPKNDFETLARNFMNDDTFNNENNQFQDSKGEIRFTDNSFCQMNHYSEQSSIAIVRAQDRIYYDPDNYNNFQYSNQKNKSYYQNQNNSLSKNVENFYKYDDSPLKLTVQNLNMNLSKDNSPSFGCQTKQRKSIFETDSTHNISFQQRRQQEQQHNSQYSVLLRENKEKQQQNIRVFTYQGNAKAKSAQKVGNYKISNNHSVLNSRPGSSNKLVKQVSSNHTNTNNKTVFPTTHQIMIGQYQSQMNRLNKIMQEVTNNKKKRESYDINNNRTMIDGKNDFSQISNKNFTTKRHSFLFLHSNNQDNYNISSQQLNQSKSLIVLDQSQHIKNYENKQNISATYNTKLCQSRSQINLMNKENNQSSFKSITPRKVVNQNSNNVKYPKYNPRFLKNLKLDQSCFLNSCLLDPEKLYEYRAKSVIKKKEEISKKKEEMNRKKLNEKMAKIQEIQKKREEQKIQIQEKRCSKSPCKAEAIIVMNAPKNAQSVINYATLQTTINYGSIRTPQPRTPQNVETRNDFHKLDQSHMFLSQFNNMSINEETIKQSKSGLCSGNGSLENSKQCSRIVTPEIYGTPLTQQRRNYDTNPNTSINKNYCKLISSTSTYELNEAKEKCSSFISNIQSTQKVNNQQQTYGQRKSSTSSLFQKNNQNIKPSYIKTAVYYSQQNKSQQQKSVHQKEQNKTTISQSKYNTNKSVTSQSVNKSYTYQPLSYKEQIMRKYGCLESASHSRKNSNEKIQMNIKKHVQSIVKNSGINHERNTKNSAFCSDLGSGSVLSQYNTTNNLEPIVEDINHNEFY